MRMLKKIICIVLCATALCQLPSKAAVIQNTEKGIVITEYEMQPKAEYPVIIVRPNKVIEDLSDGNDSDIIAYAGTVFSDDKGKYELEIAMDDYTAGLYVFYGGTDVEKRFWFATKQDKQQALSVFAGNDKETIYTYLSDENKVYAVLGQEDKAYKDYYGKLTEDGKKKVAEGLLGFRINGSVNTIGDIDKVLSDFSNKFLEISRTVFADYGFAGIKSILTSDNVLDVLKSYNDIFEIDLERIGDGQIYNTALYNALNKKENLTKEELCMVCYEQNAVCKINALNKFNAGAFLDIVRENADVFGAMLDETGFNKLSSETLKESVLAKVVEKNNYVDADEVRKYLADAVKNPVPTPTNKPSNSSSSSSSSGSGFVQTKPNVSQKPDATTKPNESVGADDKNQTFADMAGYDWAVEAVEGLYNKGFISGVSDMAFEPGRSINREEFLTMMLRAFGVALNSSEQQFADVDANAYYAPYVNAAYNIGIINGISNTEFGVGKPIIRQDAAVILNNLLKYRKSEISADNEYSITDQNDISDYALEAVESLVGKGIISGNEDHRFLPKKTLSRAEAAVLLYRYVRRNEQ